jgi:hypothetical protein
MTLGARSQVLCEEMIKGMVEDVRQKGIPGFPGASMTIQRVCQPYTVAR